MRDLKWYAAIACALALAAGMTGCGGGGGGGGTPITDDVAPTVTVTQWDQSTPDSSGGTVSIRATATDNVGVTQVTATITAPDSSQITRTLTLSAGVYSTSFTAAANAGTTAQTYTFRVYARDAAGNMGSSDLKSVTVPSSEVPPPPPW